VTAANPSAGAVRRAVMVFGPFPAELNHLETLADDIELTVYGTTYRPPWYSYEPTPPRRARFRDFSPRGLRERGHLWWTYPGMAAALERDQPDVIHVVSEPWGLLAQQATSWAKDNPEVGLVFHGCDQIWWHGSRMEQAVRRRLAARTLRRADGFLGETQAAVDMARSAGLGNQAITAAVHTNPRDPATFRPASDPAEQAEERRRLGLPPDGIGVGFIGVLRPEKGAMTFLGAVEELDRQGRLDDQTWITIAGGGVERDAVASRSRELDVYYLGPLRYSDEVAPFLRAIDVLVVPSISTPSWTDQSPRVVIEAMLSGCTVIGSTCGAIPDMVGETGVIVPEGDVTALARAIETTSKSWSLATNCAAREEALRHYSHAAVAQKLHQCWTGAMHRVSVA